MEQKKLPNVTISLILGIISFVACCFSYGIGGILFSGIALFLANKDKKAAQPDPESYENYGQLKTARIIAIVGLILGVISLLIGVVMLVMFGSLEAIQQWAEEIQAAQQS